MSTFTVMFTMKRNISSPLKWYPKWRNQNELSLKTTGTISQTAKPQPTPFNGHLSSWFFSSIATNPPQNFLDWEKKTPCFGITFNTVKIGFWRKKNGILCKQLRCMMTFPKVILTPPMEKKTRHLGRFKTGAGSLDTPTSQQLILGCAPTKCWLLTG